MYDQYILYFKFLHIKIFFKGGSIMNKNKEMQDILQMNKETEAVYKLAETLSQSIMDRNDTS